MIILCGKTCSGKSTVANILQEVYGYKRVVTYTTRPPREGEVDGIEYHFISEGKFKLLQANEFFFETTFYEVASGDTYFYGTSKESLIDNSVIVMNPEGLKKMIRLLDPDIFHIIVIYLNVTEGNQFNRLRKRGDSSAEVTRRIEADKKDFEDIDQYYDFSISTDSFNIFTSDVMSPNDIAEWIDMIIKWEESKV